MSKAPRIDFPEELRVQYEPLRTLGRGGMGAVFLARDLELDREVALKVMLTTESATRDRFVREAAVLAGLKHPNILEVFSWGEAGEIPYIVMEYLEGEPLGKLPKDSDFLDPMLQAAAGIEEVHRAGLVHRDLKPDNIVLTRSGEAKLLDFGLVSDPNRTKLTGTGMLVGTVAYLAPEVLLGADVSPASDWYAWGATLYTLLERDHPYEMDVLLEALAGSPLPPATFRKIRPGSPEHELIRRCLSAIPEHRPGSVEEIQAILEGRAPELPLDPVPAAEFSAPGAAAPARLPRPAIIGGLLVAMVLGGVLWPDPDTGPEPAAPTGSGDQPVYSEHFRELLEPAGLHEKLSYELATGPIPMGDGRLVLATQDGESVILRPGHPSTIEFAKFGQDGQPTAGALHLATEHGGGLRVTAAFADGPLIPGTPPRRSHRLKTYSVDLPGRPAKEKIALAPEQPGLRGRMFETTDGKYSTQHAYLYKRKEDGSTPFTYLIAFSGKTGGPIFRRLTARHNSSVLEFPPFPSRGGYVFGIRGARKDYPWAQLPTVLASLAPDYPEGSAVRWRLDLQERPLSPPAPWSDGVVLLHKKRLIFLPPDTLRGDVGIEEGQVLWTFEEVPYQQNGRSSAWILPHAAGLDVFLCPRVDTPLPQAPPIRWLRFVEGDFSRPPVEVPLSFPDGIAHAGSDFHLRAPAVFAGGTRVALCISLAHGQGGVFLLDVPRQRVLKYRDLRGRDPLKIVRPIRGAWALERPELGGTFLYVPGSGRHLYEWFRPTPRRARPGS